MYSVRLFVRSLAREMPFLEQRLAFSAKSRLDERSVGRPRKANNAIQRAGARKQQKTRQTTTYTNLDDDDDDDEVLDLAKADMLYDAHFAELKYKHRKHGLAEYRQKYYKTPKEPTLLSWEDMTQIRHLYKANGWPISALANSFPANEAVIQKVVDSQGRIASPEEQLKHDQKVAANWILLRKGKLELSESLRLHCLKFTNREARPMTFKDVAEKNEKPPRPPGSFYNLLHPKNEEEQAEAKEKEEARWNDRDSFDPKSTLRHVNRRVTLEEVRKTQLEYVAKEGLGPKEEDKAFLYGSSLSRENLSQVSEQDNSIKPKTDSEKSITTKSKSITNTSKWSTDGNSKAAAKQMMAAPYDVIPQRIDIPENAKKPGALYRVDDCFYDEDGEFLYRVPGLKF